MPSTDDSSLYKEYQAEDQADKGLSIALPYRPPYRFQEMLSFLEGRAIPGVELVANDHYIRTVRLMDSEGDLFSGCLRVGHDPASQALTATVSESLRPVLPQIRERLRGLFDLDCEPETVYQALSSMKEIVPDALVPGTRVPGSFDGFEMAVRAVLGQQISVKAASTLAGRLVDTFGTEIKTDLPELKRLFPQPGQIVRLGEDIENQLGALGVVRTRSRTIYELAKAFEDGSIDFSASAQVETELKKLLAIRGIGPWTAKYIAMRTMGWKDAFLETDAGIKKALNPYSPKEMLELAEAWRPWRSYATVNLWNSL
ncbi:MAG: 3-methyladenine DNA glycosylase 2 [Clostridiaceae bacterium]|nr:3-methyladenine DNA glycosylase 2 [Clostridiaceae bacterium]